MPSIEYTEIEHYANVDTTVDIYDHEVHTTFDPSEYKQEVLDAIKFDGSSDLLTWVVREKNMSADDIFQTLLDQNMVSTHLRTNQKQLKDYTTDQLFREIMGRNIGEVI